MKKSYDLPEITKVEFESEDIITASAALITGEHHAGETSSQQMESVWNEELGM